MKVCTRLRDFLPIFATADGRRQAGRSGRFQKGASLFVQLCSLRRRGAARRGTQTKWMVHRPRSGLTSSISHLTALSLFLPTDSQSADRHREGAKGRKGRSCGLGKLNPLSNPHSNKIILQQRKRTEKRAPVECGITATLCT